MQRSRKFGEIPPKRFMKYRVHKLSGCTDAHKHTLTDNPKTWRLQHITVCRRH